MGRPKKVTEPVQDAPVSETRDPVAELSAKFDKLADIVGDLAEKIYKEEPQKEVPKAVEDVSGEDRVTDLSKRFPLEWRESVSRILGKNFDLRVEDTANGDFMAIITIPQQWDRRAAKDDQIIKQDVSTGLMRRSSPLPDLEGWCAKILANLKSVHPNFQP